MKNPIRLMFCIVGCELIGVLGGIYTLSSITNWYQFLNKPFFSPPNWVLAPVWTTLYFLMGVSVFLIWQKGYKKSNVKLALDFFIIQLFLNFLWSFLFFGLRSPILAFAEILLLLFFIFKTYKAFSKISKSAAGLLIPYLIWVSFASLLNLALVVLNY